MLVHFFLRQMINPQMLTNLRQQNNTEMKWVLYLGLERYKGYWVLRAICYGIRRCWIVMLLGDIFLFWHPIWYRSEYSQHCPQCLLSKFPHIHVGIFGYKEGRCWKTVRAISLQDWKPMCCWYLTLTWKQTLPWFTPYELLAPVHIYAKPANVIGVALNPASSTVRLRSQLSAIFHTKFTRKYITEGYSSII